MKNKYLKILIIIAIALALVMAGVILVKESGLDTSKIVEVHLEYIDEDGSIERVQVTDPADVDYIKVFFNTDTTTDSPPFEEGGYRIILAQPDKEWHLYPYCGDLSVVRIGDSSGKYVMTSDIAELETVLNKYIDIDSHKGIHDWKTAIMEDIKN